MKLESLIVLAIILTSCSSARLVDSWKNPEIGIYDPYKVLVVGLTSDEAAKLEFELEMKKELELRGSEVVMSHDILNSSTKSNEMAEVELEALEGQLLANGFDTIILTKIVGIENKRRYLINFKSYEETFRKFKDDYLMYQQSYYNSNENEKYTVYNAETSIYCICPTKERELIWKGYIDITDPKSVRKTVKDYIKSILEALEENLIIPNTQ